jgi:hypothetical protein
MLRTVEAPDLADFEDLVKGSTTLKALRDQGINTEAIKKIKPTEGGNEVELFDRAGVDFDRVVEHTDGKPHQTADVTSGGQPIGPESIIASILGKLLAGNPPGATGGTESA